MEGTRHREGVDLQRHMRPSVSSGEKIPHSHALCAAGSPLEHSHLPPLPHSPSYRPSIPSSLITWRGTCFREMFPQPSLNLCPHPPFCPSPSEKIFSVHDGRLSLSLPHFMAAGSHHKLILPWLRDLRFADGVSS